MSEDDKITEKQGQASSGRRAFFFTALGGAVAAVAGWVAGAFPKGPAIAEEEDTGLTPADARISALEARVSHLTEQLAAASTLRPLAQLEGEFDERVTFNKSELTLNNPEGVLLNLVATNGHVGIRFYKDFGFGNEQVTNPWHMGFIEGVDGYQGLAILRDWRFTAALWAEDGRLLLGNLDPHPPANEPPKARVHVRGTLDEVQTIVEASTTQTADIFQVLGGQGTPHFAVDRDGNAVLGSLHDPRELILHDTQAKGAYSLKVTNGQLSLTRL